MKHNKVATMKLFQHTVVALAAAVSSTWVLADGAIQAVTGSLQGGAEVIRIELSEPLTTLPTGFATQSPARIALDFPETANSMGRSLVEINQGNLKSVNIVQAGNRSRVVLNLKQATAYRAQIEGNTLLVSLDPVGASASGSAQPAPVTVFAADGNSGIVPIKDVDFRRGVDGAGPVRAGRCLGQPAAQCAVALAADERTRAVDRVDGEISADGSNRR